MSRSTSQQFNLAGLGVELTAKQWSGLVSVLMIVTAASRIGFPRSTRALAAAHLPLLPALDDSHAPAIRDLLAEA